MAIDKTGQLEQYVSEQEALAASIDREQIALNVKQQACVQHLHGLRRILERWKAEEIADASNDCNNCEHADLTTDEEPCNQCTRNLARRFQDNWKPA